MRLAGGVFLVLIDCGTNTDISHGRVALILDLKHAVIDSETGRNAHFRQALIDRRNADGSADLVTVYDHALEGEGSAQQLVRRIHVSVRDQLLYDGGADLHLLAVDSRCDRGFYRQSDSVFVALLTKQLRIPFFFVAESEILTADDMGDIQLRRQIFDELLG